MHALLIIPPIHAYAKPDMPYAARLLNLGAGDYREVHTPNDGPAPKNVAVIPRGRLHPTTPCGTPESAGKYLQKRAGASMQPRGHDVQQTANRREVDY